MLLGGLNINFKFMFNEGKILEQRKEEDIEEKKDIDLKNVLSKNFLSLDLGVDIEDKLIKIGESLKDKPEVADKLFAEYARIVDGVEQDVVDLEKMYNEVFFDRPIDKNRASYAVLRNGFELLKNAQEELDGCDDEKKVEVVEDLILKLRREEKIKKSVLKNLIDINKNYNENRKAFLKDLFIQDGEYAVMCEMFGDPEKYESSEKLNEAIKNKEVIPWWTDENLSVENFFDKIDGQILNNIIQSSVKSIEKKEKMLLDEGYYKMMDPEDIKKFGQPDPIDVATFERNKKEIEQAKDKIKKANKILQFQKNLEQKLDEFVYAYQELKLPDNLDENVSDLIFQKYQEIIDQTKKSRKKLESLFLSQKDLSNQDLDKISETVLKKASQLLNDFSEKIIKGEEYNEKSLISDLEEYKEDLILTASIWKSIDKENVNIEDLKGFEFEKKTISEFTLNGEVFEDIHVNKDGLPFIPGSVAKRRFEVDDMFKIYKKNFSKKPEGMRKIVLEGFENKLKTLKEGTVLYLLKKDDKLLGFLRFDSQENGNKYFGSFNVLSNIQDSAIGTALLKKAFEEQGDAVIEADCSFFDDVGRYYVEKCGFVIKQSYDFEGEPSLSIEKDLKKNYLYRDIPKSKIIAEYKEKFSNNIYQNDDKIIILKFEKNSVEKIKESEKLLNSNEYVMTRYFTEKDDKEEKQFDYCVFESLSN